MQYRTEHSDRYIHLKTKLLKTSTKINLHFNVKEENTPATPSKQKADSDYFFDHFINLNELTEPLECKDCKLPFHTNLDLGLHSKHHTEDGFYSCHMCEYRNDSSKLFRNHIRLHDTFMCKKCKQIFKNRQTAQKHIIIHEPRVPIPCEMCGKTFKTLKYLKDHQKKVHPENAVDARGPFKCTKCDKQYKYPTALKHHCSSHHRELGLDTSAICDICGKRLSSNTNLRQHVRIHTGDKPYHCTVCQMNFTSKDILRNHVRKHKGDKPYVCTYCGKKYSHGSAYRYHLKTHTGEKSWSCPLCTKGFITKGNMKIHLKTCEGPVKKAPNPRKKVLAKSKN